MAEYQYVGSGEDPPSKINFMGRVQFTLNHKYVDVTDPVVLAKIEGNPSFKLKKPKVKRKASVKKKAKAKPETGDGDDNTSS